MRTATPIHLTLGLALAMATAIATPAVAAAPGGITAGSAQAASPLREIPDPELATLRGRFMLGSNTVAYFGVTMASSWVAANGQTLTGNAVLGMYFDVGSTPVVSFTPTLNIVQGTPTVVATADSMRSVDGTGLTGINGLLQGIQVAGDDDRVSNATTLHVSQGGAVPVGAATTHGASNAQLTAGNAHVAIAFNPARGIEMTLGIAGQGLVSQWIRNSSVGQLVQLTSDGQTVNNRLQLDLMLGGAGSVSSQALRAASEALLQAHTVGGG